MRRHHTKIALFWRDLHKHETDHEDDAAESGIGGDDGLLDQGQDGDGLRLKQHWRKTRRFRAGRPLLSSTLRGEILRTANLPRTAISVRVMVHRTPALG